MIQTAKNPWSLWMGLCCK